MHSELMEIYQRLYKHFGPQYWWPAQTPFEMMVGAVLTQNTAWSNVEKALVPLRKQGLLTPLAMRRLPEKTLARMIRPCGFFNVKARRLKALTEFIFKEYGGSLTRMFSENGKTLREKLLGVKGVGPETADSILLYAGHFPVFVVDAYTRRIFSRHGFMDGKGDYHDIQDFFMHRLPQKTQLFNEYHALIVKTGKSFCKIRPDCSSCPLEYLFRR